MADDSKDARPAQDRDDDAWIERVVAVAGHLGFNQMRLRWKLIRWQEQRRRSARQREQVISHITYAHKTCPECGAVQDRDERVCTGCEARLGGRGVQVLERLGVAMPVAISMSTLLALAILAGYARAWIAGGGGLASPSGTLLVDLGGAWPPLLASEPWRLVTAMFLHGGLLHLLFNVLSLATIGPRIEDLYGRATMVGLFIATGVLANLGSAPLGPLGVGIGASGGVMGLIGVAAAAGHRAGTSHGRELRNDMLKWSAYVFLFGFVVHADNWAHLFGLLAGGAFGFAVRPETWARRTLLPLRAILGLAGVFATLAAVALILSRTPSPVLPDEAEDEDAVIDAEALDDTPAELPPRSP